MKRIFEKLNLVEEVNNLSVNEETKTAMKECLLEENLTVCDDVDELMKSLESEQ